MTVISFFLIQTTINLFLFILVNQMKNVITIPVFLKSKKYCTVLSSIPKDLIE